MDSFAILLFALIIVVYLIPCTPITISENFRGGGGGGGFGGGHGSGGFGGRSNLSSGSFSRGRGGHGIGMMHHNNAGSLTSGYRNNGRYGQGRGRYLGNYGPFGAGYWGPGWWGYSGGDDGEFIDEDGGGNVVINDNSNYSNNYYQNDFDSDYVSPLQQQMMTSGNEQEKN